MAKARAGDKEKYNCRDTVYGTNLVKYLSDCMLQELVCGIWTAVYGVKIVGSLKFVCWFNYARLKGSDSTKRYEYVMCLCNYTRARLKTWINVYRIQDKSYAIANR